jgi:hypothetical protein
MASAGRLGFVWPECRVSACTHRVRLAKSRCRMRERVGFVWPRWLPLSALGSFGQTVIRRLAPVGFLRLVDRVDGRHLNRHDCRQLGSGEGSVELPDCAFAARQGAPLVTIKRHRPREHGVVQGGSGEELAACAAHARHIELRRRNAARHLEALRDGAGPCNCPRQGADFLRQGGLEPRRPAQAVPERIARGARLARRRLRTPAGAAVGPAGLTPALAGHSVPFACRARVHVMF